MMVTIDVDEECIKNGQRGRCQSCPIALAVNKRLRDFYRSHVSGNLAFFGPGVMLEYSTGLPEIAVRFIHDFDVNAEVKPFSFLVEIPAQYLKEPEHAVN